VSTGPSSPSHSPVRRYFVVTRVGWVVWRETAPAALRFWSAYGEERVLHFPPAQTLPSEAHLAAASETDLQDWLTRSRPESR
jgi:hypothetical protein